MRFTAEDQYRCMQQAACFLKMFPNKGQSFNGLKHLTEKNDSSGIIDSCMGYGWPLSTKIKDLALIFDQCLTL